MVAIATCESVFGEILEQQSIAFFTFGIKFFIARGFEFKLKITIFNQKIGVAYDFRIFGIFGGQLVWVLHRF